ncbi:MAG: SDR family oxidoreductase [Novosphingobium sp.]
MIEHLYDLSGRTAIVTGGGSGIGKAISALLAAAGARVVIADIAHDIASQTAAELGNGAIAVATDVSDEASVLALYAAAQVGGHRVDVVVNNAGIFPKQYFVEQTVEVWDRMQAVNLRGVFLMMREAVKAMQADGKGGSIINISSVSSIQAAVFSNQAYGASKGGVSNLTKSCAAEFAPDNIRVNAVMPGAVATDGAKNASGSFPVKGPLTSPARMPLGRVGTPADIANATLFFASDASSYITGQLLAVDGGFLVS